MKLSIVIVNYNVKYFLEQCLHSVQNACQGIDSEIFVTDNNSVDGSIKMVKEKFPDVILIENKENKGFSYANNQAIRKSRGEYILLLNPDTIVEDDTLRKVVDFMDQHPDAGGLGVKMLDGKGKFLPESKRGLPTPSVAFFKVFGFSSLFPKSRLFSRYHLGFLDKDQIHEVDVLAGAFMLLRKKVLNEIGLLDESFFMYGEDIDLSYRISLAGYKNYYYPGTRIIHYKGESTKKGSLNYVFVFYNAMIVFAKKHFSKKNARVFSLMINLAIYFRAFLSILTRFAKRIILPFLDASLIFIGIFFITSYWEKHFIFPDGGHYPFAFISIAVPVYLAIWLLCIYLSGGYDKPIKLRKIIQGMIAGTIIILVLYSLLNEHYRFSRALIFLGAIWGTTVIIVVRLFLHVFNINGYKLNVQKTKRFIIVGEKEESDRVRDLLQQTGMNPAFIGMVSFHHHRYNSNGFIGHLGQIKEIITIHKIDEVIFCAKDVPAQVIIDKMAELKNEQVDYKIAPPESLSIIGSNSINTSGDLYVIDINTIIKRANRRNKRMLDFTVSCSLFLLYPFMIFFVKKPLGLLKNIGAVLFSYKSWVGYIPLTENESQRLPEIKKGVLHQLDALNEKNLPLDTSSRLNFLYARDYKLLNDINIIIKGFRELGRR
ncbi:MAG: glycosyltransferase [Bacteroidales bacterium]|nr:glycosyltransferase family 2 protein [Bacteroidales bacterium]MDD4603097.1 glycosyltransferase [Bacteroidales bacterium]